MRGLLAHRRRVALATGSVALGVASVLVTSALGQGAREALLRDVARMGTNLLVVRPTQVERHVARPAIRGRVSTLRPEDCRELAALPEVREVAPSRDGGARVKVGRRSMSATVFGTSPDFFSLRALRLRSGRFLLRSENDAALRVAVLGARVADTLFPDADPTGTTIRIRGVPFVVVGVLESRGVLADGSDEDSNVLVPIRTALRRVFNTTWITGIFVSAVAPEKLDAAEEAMAAEQAHYPEALFYEWAGIPSEKIISMLNERYGYELEPAKVAAEKERLFLEKYLDRTEPIEPVTSNDTEMGRQRNRRVELETVKN